MNQTQRPAQYLGSVNISTKLQQQVLMIPDVAKAQHHSVQVKGRNSPRVFQTE